MAMRCTICTHKELEAIDRALLAGEPVAPLAARHGVSRQAIIRHRDNHLAERMAEVAERNAEADVRTALDVIAQLRRINGEAWEVLESARSADDRRSALSAIAEVRQQIELQAKLIDLLPGEGTTININTAPEIVQLRTVIVNALEPYPEARLAVAAALEEVARAG